MSTIPKNDHPATVERERVSKPPTKHKPSFSEDCTITAYHEAGHAVAAHALGLQAVSTIWWDAGAKLITEGLAAGREQRKTFIYANNRLEGNALATVEAMLARASASS